MLLLTWLMEGVAVARILQALEAAHVHRRKRRIRAPLELRHAKRHLKGLRKAAAPPALPASAPEHPLQGAIHEVLNQASPWWRPEQAQPLADALRGLQGDDTYALVESALEHTGHFFQRCLEQLDAPSRDRLRSEAEESLGDTLTMVGPEVAQVLVEEQQRSLLRALLPSLTATALLQQLDP